MKRWEYATVTLSAPIGNPISVTSRTPDGTLQEYENVPEALGEMGANGWELAAIDVSHGTGLGRETYYWLKREVEK